MYPTPGDFWDDREIPFQPSAISHHPFPWCPLGHITQGSKVESHKELLLEARLLPKEMASIPEEWGFYDFFWGGKNKTKTFGRFWGDIFFVWRMCFFTVGTWVGLSHFQKNSFWLILSFLFVSFHPFKYVLFTKNHFVGWLDKIITAPWKLKMDTKHDGL